MKESFIKKIKRIMYNYSYIPGVLFFVSLYILYISAPVNFFHKKTTGVVTNISRQEMHQYTTRSFNPVKIDSYCIRLNEKHTDYDSSFYIRYEVLHNFDPQSILNKKIEMYFMSVNLSQSSPNFFVDQLSIGNTIIYSLDDGLYIFYRWLVIAMLCLIWCVWAFSVYWKRDEKQELKENLERIRKETQMRLRRKKV